MGCYIFIGIVFCFVLMKWQSVHEANRLHSLSSHSVKSIEFESCDKINKRTEKRCREIIFNEEWTTNATRNFSAIRAEFIALRRRKLNQMKRKSSLSLWPIFDEFSRSRHNDQGFFIDAFPRCWSEKTSNCFHFGSNFIRSKTVEIIRSAVSPRRTIE